MKPDGTRAEERIMVLDEELEFLREIPLFSRIELARLKFLAFASRQTTFGEGEELFRQGDVGDAAYIIIDGEVDVIVEGPNGEVPITRLGKYDLVGEIAIIVDVPRTATVRTVGEMTALVISKELFSRMVKQFPEIAVEIMRELALRLERTTAQLTKTS